MESIGYIPILLDIFSHVSVSHSYQLTQMPGHSTTACVATMRQLSWMVTTDATCGATVRIIPAVFANGMSYF